MKIQPILSGAMSGSLGGMTASHNKGGQYLRARTVPTNPNTARQQAVRSIVGGLTQDWATLLTEVQRQAWRTYAENVPVTDTLGQSMTLSGINWLIKTRTNREQAIDAGATVPAVTLDAPVLFNTGVGVQSLTEFEADFTTPPGTLNIAGELGGTTDEAGDVLIYIAPPQTPGVRFYKGPYQFAAALPVAASATTWGVPSPAPGIDLATEWFSSIVPVAGWDGLFVPIKVVVIYDDNRRAQTFRQLVQFTDVTP